MNRNAARMISTTLFQLKILKEALIRFDAEFSIEIIYIP